MTEIYVVINNYRNSTEILDSIRKIPGLNLLPFNLFTSVHNMHYLSEVTINFLLICLNWKVGMVIGKVHVSEM